MAEVENLLAQASAAVTGPGTPNEVSVSKPDKFSWVNRIAIPLLIISVVILVIVLLAWGAGWHIWSSASELIRAHYVGGIGIALCLMLAVLVFAMTGNKVGRIDVHMGPGSFSMGADDAAPKS